MRLFERLHKQLVLTEAGQAFLPEVTAGFRRLASATARLRPTGVLTLLTLIAHHLRAFQKSEISNVNK